MMRKIFLFGIWLVILIGVTACELFLPDQVIFYVAPQGMDTHAGTIEQPFATPERASDAIRQWKEEHGMPEHGFIVYMREGIYSMDHTLDLDETDGGTAFAPVVWKAYAGEDVVFSGGKVISDFEAVRDTEVLKQLTSEARRQVVQANLKDYGISEFPTLQKSGFGKAITPLWQEVFFDGKPMTLARYPNEGWLTIADVPQSGELKYQGDVANPGATFNNIPGGRHYGRFTYSDDRPERWTNTGDIWMHGYWVWDWADMYDQVDAIDAEKNEVYLSEPYHHYGYREGQRYYYLNVLAELDTAGEWYLDRDRGMLYLWPPSSIDSADVMVSLLEKPLISLENTSFISFEGITFEACRGTAITIAGGTYNSISGSTFRNIGNYALTIDGGTFNGIRNCEIFNTGDGGVIINGGDRSLLSAGKNFVVNCHIHHYSRMHRTNRPAILMEGVGNVLSHNHIHDAPHMGVRFHGNNHVLEFNEIHDIAKETGDVGAFYVGRDWTYRGNIIRYNYFHDLHGPGLHGVMAVYLDDWASGTTIFGNVFYKAGRSAFIGGGRYNTIENNMFIVCEPSVHIDARGISWGKYYFDRASEHFRSTLFDRMEELNYQQPPYSEEYPELLTIADDEPALPKYNKIVRNISFNGRWLNLYDGLEIDDFMMERNFIADTALLRQKRVGQADFTTYTMDDKSILEMLEEKDNIVTDKNPGFVDWENQNFNLTEDAPAYAIGFTPIPLSHIGTIGRDQHPHMYLSDN